MWKEKMKVYAWNGEDFAYAMDKEPIIGEIIEVSHDACYVKSIIDGFTYLIAKYRLYEVGTGPACKDSNVIYEDYYV